MSLADDANKNIVIYVHNFFPEFKTSLAKLSQRLGRPLRGIMLVDAERKASGNYIPDKEGVFEEVVVDFSDDAALRKAIRPYEEQLLLVNCDSESGQLYFKKLIPHVPYVNTPTESSIDYCTDKGKMRELFLSYDKNISPRAIVAHDASEETVERIVQELKFPLMVKPTHLAASMLVNKVTNKDNLGETLDKSFASLNEIYSRLRGLGGKTLVVEEFVEGDLYSTDAYVDAKGKVYVLPFIHFENGSQVGMDGYQVYRSETYLTLNDDDLRAGVKTAEKAIHAVGLRSSVAHIELFHTIHGWKIIELGARPGGWRQETYEVSYGIDHSFNILLIKLGLEPEMPSGMKAYSATFRIHAPVRGVIDSIIGLEEARDHPNMRTLEVNIKPGDKVLPATQGGDTLVCGLMYNENLEQLNHDIENTRASIQVNIKPTQ